MKIPLVNNSYKKPRGDDQTFAQETDLLRSHGHLVLPYQRIPAVQTITVGAGQ